MKKFTLTVCAFCAFIFSSYAAGLLINNPQFTWQQKTQGYITEPTMVITPKGVYAQVEFTFRIHCQNSYSPTDSLEAVLDFDLPSNSFIHNSWLWLDDLTIIQADLIDRGRAIQIYEGIVKRRRDPSLLLQTGNNSYRLNVYPLSTGYARKVKIVYSIPFYWLKNRVNIPLPTDILNASSIKPSLTLIVKGNNNFTAPYFSEQAFSSYIIASSGNDQILQIPSTVYQNSDLTLNFQTNLNSGVLLNTYPTDINSGIYQLVVNPEQILGPPTPKSVVFILDHSGTSGTIYSFAQIKSNLKSYLLNQFSNTDSFNIFYNNTSGVLQQAFPTWVATDSFSVVTALNSLPASINNNNLAKYEDLLKNALMFSKSKPGNSSQVVLISNSSVISSQALADTTFNRLNNYLGGFSNKIQIINNSSYNLWIGTTYVLVNELLYSKLSLASGGNYFKYSGSGSSISLDVKNILKDIHLQMGTSLTAYAINLPVNSGFVYSRYDINRLNRFSTSAPYVETGKYYGTMQNGNVDIQLLTPSGAMSGQLPVTNVEQVTSHSRQAWAFHYMNELISLNGNNIYTSEIIDTSMWNRVLCPYTAFLAVETGDTVNISVNEHGPGNGGGGSTELDEFANNTIKCYPNPFTTEIAIEFIKPVEELLIMDITGRVIFVYKPAQQEKKFTWNGRNENGAAVPAGIYIIKAKNQNGITTMKVLKQ